MDKISVLYNMSAQSRKSLKSGTVASTTLKSFDVVNKTTKFALMFDMALLFDFNLVASMT